MNGNKNEVINKVYHMNKLRELRNEKKLTLREMAEIIRIDKSTLSRYERSEQEIKASDLAIFCNFFGVSADYILGNTDSRSLTTSSPTLSSEPNNSNPTLIALHNQAEALSDEQLKQVISYVEFLKCQENK